ncbi:MAG: hypothetical protein DHS20C21_09640 [Gemmatimonadota bacterium]|nr:MAG: hypothetical protein DHS20C21_09640 [Gemmatimonadota bacterium]
MRGLMLMVALWAVTIAPVLCTTGVLAHECACEDERVCDHEADCEVDPCDELVFRRGDADPDMNPHLEPASATLAPLWEAAARAVLPMAPFSPDRPPSSGVPHASDLPLLS